MLVIVTVAPGSAAPLLSSTLPTMLPYRTCACATDAPRQPSANRNTVRPNSFCLTAPPNLEPQKPAVRFSAERLSNRLLQTVGSKVRGLIEKNQLLKTTCQTTLGRSAIWIGKRLAGDGPHLPGRRETADGCLPRPAAPRTHRFQRPLRSSPPAQPRHTGRPSEARTAGGISRICYFFSHARRASGERRHLGQLSVVPRQPLVELRHVRVEHRDLLVDHVVDRDRDVGRNGAGFWNSSSKYMKTGFLRSAGVSDATFGTVTMYAASCSSTPV